MRDANQPQEDAPSFPYDVTNVHALPLQYMIPPLSLMSHHMTRLDVSETRQDGQLYELVTFWGGVKKGEEPHKKRKSTTLHVPVCIVCWEYWSLSHSVC